MILLQTGCEKDIKEPLRLLNFSISFGKQKRAKKGVRELKQITDLQRLDERGRVTPLNELTIKLDLGDAFNFPNFQRMAEPHMCGLTSPKGFGDNDYIILDSSKRQKDAQPATSDIFAVQNKYDSFVEQY